MNHHLYKTNALVNCKANFDIEIIKTDFENLKSAQESLRPSNMDQFIFNHDVKRIRAFVKAINKDCETKTKAECFGQVWDFIDVNVDSKLSLAELARFMKLLAKQFYSQQSRSSDSKMTFTLGALLSATVVAKAYLSNYDFNNDEFLSKQEILYDTELLNFSNLETDSSMGEKIKRLIEKGAKALPIPGN